MREHKSFNKSLGEELFYTALQEVFNPDDIERQYSTDTRYPFACDFYIKSLDLFIELNLHWSHGLKPFDSTDPADLQKLND